MTPPATERPSERAPSTVTRPPERNDARARVRQLRAEADASGERIGKAMLLYEAGYLNEIVLHQPAQAVQDYLAAYNTDNRSRLPLFALVRMFERRRSYKNLARLYEAELRSARSPVELATALTDQASLSTLTGEPPERVTSRLEQALEQDASGEAALLLEWRRRAEGDQAGAERALAKRSEACDALEARAAMLLEIAHLREAHGELDAALEALRTAALSGHPVSDVYAAALARFARKHGFALELVEASERRAEVLAAELARGEGGHDGDAELRRELRARALAHWYEAARLRCTSLGDPSGALRAVEAALALAPDDVALKQLRMFAYDLLEDRSRAAAEASALLEAGLSGPQAAALHFRLAESHLVAGEVERAREKLGDTVAAAGGSAAAEAILDDLLLDEQRHDMRISQREALAAQLEPPRAQRALAEAAQIAAAELRDGERARALYARADALVPGNPELLREAYGSALDLGDRELAAFALARLLALALDLDERAALLHHRFELADEAERRALLDAYARDEPAAHVIKLLATHAASQRAYHTLGGAHEALARGAGDAEETLAELCAAARAYLRAGEPGEARTLLEQALERAPAHGYALTLLEELLRDQGDASGAIALLRRAAHQHESAREAELHLLAAGAAAEVAGDAARAAESYLEAAGTLGSRSALWALYRLAQRRDDVDLERKAREELAARERSEGRFGVDTLLLAEHYDLVDHDPSRAAGLLRAALEDVDVGHHAAIGIVISRSVPSELRERALELLATRATDSLRPALLRELGGELVAQGGSAMRALELAERVRLVRTDDRWAAFTRTHAGISQGAESHAAALESLAEITSDGAVADCARAEALWTRQLGAAERPLEEALTAVLPEGAELGVELAQAILELASPAHDGALRVRALSVLAKSAPAEQRPKHLVALARAQLSEGDAAAAVTCLEELLAKHPERVDGWELALEASRVVRHAKLHADAAQLLGEHLGGDDALELLVESARVRMDQLDDPEGAELLLERVLARAPEREEAYQRLHELRTERDDTPGLIELVQKRTQLVDDAEELARLYYELARLERRRGELPPACDALDNVLILDDEHVGAHALYAEIHTLRGDFALAVASLDRLTASPALPAAQRRLAGLAAADFLENKLDDRAAALARLEQLVALEPQLVELHVRAADLAERHGDLARAADALEQAVQLSRDEARGALSLRYADLLAQKLGRKDAAAVWYRRTLEWAPGELSAARALLAISGDRSLLAGLEGDLRTKAEQRPRDPAPLRALGSLAELTEDRDLAYVALAALSAIDQLEADERERYQRERARALSRRILPGAVLSEADLRPLLAPHLDGAVAELLRCVFEIGPALDQHEPSRYGVGRGQRLGAREPHPVRDELAAMTGALGISMGDIYVGGTEPASIHVLPQDAALGFVMGARAPSPLAPALRHAVALQVSAFHLVTLPLLGRSAGEAANLVHAALLAAGCKLPSGVETGALEPLSRRVGKLLSRKARRALPELLKALPDEGVELEVHCQAALARTRRLALVLSGELAAALAEVSSGRDEDALDLLRTWTSAALAASRRKLGLAQ